MRCEMCLTTGMPDAVRTSWERLEISTADRKPLYELLLCGKCANRVLNMIYRRESRYGRMGESQAEPKDLQEADERGAVVPERRPQAAQG